MGLWGEVEGRQSLNSVKFWNNLFWVNTFLFLLFILSPLPAEAQYQSQYITTAGTKFLLYTPPGYTTGDPEGYPLLFSFLGGGEIGNDFQATLNSGNRGPAWLIDKNQWPLTLPFVVVSPLMEPDGTPNNSRLWEMADLDELVEYVFSQFNVNQNKVYMTGISLGATATWDYAGTYPSKITAIAPFAGNAKLSLACAIKDIPVWAFHGLSDNLVSADYVDPNNSDRVSSIPMTEGINDCMGHYTAHLTMLVATRHAGWNQLYRGSRGYDIYSWFLKFSKDNIGNTAPYVSAGLEKTIFKSNDPFYLHGYAFDEENSVANVTWTQVSGPNIQTEQKPDGIFKISDLEEGAYAFRFTAIDELGLAGSHTVDIEVVDQAPGGMNFVTGFFLRDGATNEFIKNLVDGDFINMELENLDGINIGATRNNLNGIFRFGANSDHDIRTDNNQLFFFDPIPAGNAVPDWEPVPGHYYICALPLGGNMMAPGAPGITSCINFTVFDQPLLVFYAKPGTDIGALSSWGTGLDGNGTQPVSFRENFQTFNITKTVSLDQPSDMGGVVTTLVVQSGGELVVNNSLGVDIDVESGGKIIINTSHPVNFGEVSPESDIEFEAAAELIPVMAYGNLSIMGPGTIKQLESGNIRVHGNLQVGNGVDLRGSNSEDTRILAGGDVNQGSIIQPASGNRFSLVFDGGSFRTFHFGGSALSLKGLEIASGTAVNATGDFALEIGHPTNGDLIIGNASRLQLYGNDLKIIGNSGINPGEETGKLGLEGGNLIFQNNTSKNSYLHLIEDSDRVEVLEVNIGGGGGGALYLLDSLHVIGSVNSQNGTIHSDGNLILVSSATHTAFIGPILGTGFINGSVQVQRSITEGRQYRYLGFPVSGQTIEDLQKFIPITGNFDGTSSGPGLTDNPSLFYYNEPVGGWVPFPQVSNQEFLIPGRGYAVFVRDEFDAIVTRLNGPIEQGEFQFTLTPDPDPQDNDVGWNLLANPFPSAINWRGPGWDMTGVNNTAYIRDNSNGDDTFWAWDGTTGDVEFNGKIAQGQAFWVRTTNENPSASVFESAKISEGGVVLFGQEDEISKPESLTITLSESSRRDRAFLKFVPSGSYDFLNDSDGIKRMNSYFNFFFLTGDGDPIVIKNLPKGPCGESLDIGLGDITPGTYRLSFDYFASQDLRERELSLKDQFVDSLIHIPFSSTYDFTVTDNPDSKGNDRFKLMIASFMEAPVIFLENEVLVSTYEHGNQWLLDGEPIPGAVHSVLYPTGSGEYQVKVHIEGCEKISERFTYRITGLLPTTLPFSIYPNPVKDHITISVNTNEKDFRYTIFNLQGKVIQNESLPIHEDKGPITIMIKQPLPKGIYILHIELGSISGREKFLAE